MKNHPLNFAGTGGKTGALAELGSLLAQREQTLQVLLHDDLAPAERSQLLAQIDELTTWHGEVDHHGNALLLADLACHHGLAGTEPENWATYSAGVPYDAHQAVVIALQWAPELSAELLTFFDELPDRLREEFATDLTSITAQFLLPSLAAENAYGAGPAEVTPEEIAYHAQRIMATALEKSLFLSTYADELRQAVVLAEHGGDFAAIYRLVE